MKHLQLLAPLLLCEIASAQIDYVDYQIARIGNSPNMYLYPTEGGIIASVSAFSLSIVDINNTEYFLEPTGYWRASVDQQIEAAFINEDHVMTFNGNSAVATVAALESSQDDAFQPSLGGSLAALSVLYSNPNSLPSPCGRILTGTKMLEFDGVSVLELSGPPFVPRRGDSVAGDWAADTNTLYNYDALNDSWASANSIPSSTNCVAVDEAGNYAAVRQNGTEWSVEYYERSPFGFWTLAGAAPLPFNLSVASFRAALSGNHVTVNDSIQRFAVLSVDPSGITLEDSYEIGVDGQANYWVHPNADGSIQRIQIIEQNEFEAPDLVATTDTDTVSALGGTQTIDLQGLSTYTDFQILWLGSLTGTTPGVQYGGDTIPLNFDAYLGYLLNFTGSSNITNQVGLLDANAKTTATVLIPPLDNALIGLEINHVGLAYQPVDGSLLIDRYQSFVGPISLTVTAP